MFYLCRYNIRLKKYIFKAKSMIIYNNVWLFLFYSFIFDSLQGERFKQKSSISREMLNNREKSQKRTKKQD